MTSRISSPPIMAGRISVSSITSPWRRAPSCKLNELKLARELNNKLSQASSVFLRSQTRQPHAHGGRTARRTPQRRFRRRRREKRKRREMSTQSDVFSDSLFPTSFHLCCSAGCNGGHRHRRRHAGHCRTQQYLSATTRRPIGAGRERIADVLYRPETTRRR